MIQAGVIDDEIQNQPDAVPAKFCSELRQRGRTSQCSVHGVGRNGVWRPAHVLLCKVRQDAAVLLLETRMVPGNLRAFRSGGPDADRPKEVDSEFSQPGEPLFGYACESPRTGGAVELIEPDACIG